MTVMEEVSPLLLRQDPRSELSLAISPIKFPLDESPLEESPTPLRLLKQIDGYLDDT